MEFLTATLAIRKLEGTNDKKYKKIFIAGIILIGLTGSCLNHANIQWHIPQFAINSRSVNRKDKFCETYKGDSIYIWGYWHKDVSLVHMAQGKLPSREFMNHNLSIGDWMYGQKYFNDYLEKLDIKNPAKSLIKREHTYLVDRDCTFVLDYLRKNYGKTISVKQIDTIHGVPVWKFDE